MSIVAQSPGHIVAKSPSYSSPMQLRSVHLVTLCTLSLRRRYDQRASAATVLFRHSTTWRFCHAPLRSLRDRHERSRIAVQWNWGRIKTHEVK